MRSALAWLVAIAMVGAALAGCGGTNGNPLSTGSGANGGTGGPPPAIGTAFVRILDAAPDANIAFDVYVDGTRVWQNISYGNFNGKAGGTGTAPFYITSVLAVPLAPTAHNIQLYLAGAAPGNATQQATATTAAGNTRTTVVIADNGFLSGKWQLIPFTEPVLSAPPEVSDNVVIHHAAEGAAGTIAWGTLTSTGSGSATPSPTFKGNLTYTNPPTNLSIGKLPLYTASFVNFYVATTGFKNQRTPIATFAPGTTNVTMSSTGGLVYPTPAPNAPGQPAPSQYDCDNALPPTCGGTPASGLATLPNLSLYAVDAPAPPGTTVAPIGIIGVFDSNN